MKKGVFYVIGLVGILVLVSGCATSTDTTNRSTENQNSVSDTHQSATDQNNSNTSSAMSGLLSPLDRPQERITKKPFGIYITPATSPVQPERFVGYHTGADFEIFPGEENIDVAIKAFCAGRTVYKQWVSGYGGVFIQQCTVDQQTVTVLYGHLSLSSINAAVGDEIAAGTIIGNLGQGYSHDTDGERKHLHLSIHKGSTVDLKGYVGNQRDLSGWLHPQQYL